MAIDPDKVGRSFRESRWRYSQFVVVGLIVAALAKWLSPLEWPPSLLIGAAGIAAFLRSYFEMGGQSIHLNCFDPSTLRDAMAHPENYPELQVRVCGWNVRWNDLSRREQLHFLATAEAQTR